MGLFLSMAGVAEANTSQVEDALREYAAQRSGRLEPLIVGESRQVTELQLAEQRLALIESADGNITVMYPDHFLETEEASRRLSATLQKPVFHLHAHDGDLWMYNLFVNGQELDRFSPIPDYWEEVSETDAASWSGDAAVVSQHWPNTREEQIANYLVRWKRDGEDEEGAKAYSDDGFGPGDPWQMVDFMGKVGLPYPDEAEDEHRVSLYLLSVGVLPVQTPDISPGLPRKHWWQRLFK